MGFGGGGGGPSKKIGLKGGASRKKNEGRGGVERKNWIKNRIRDVYKWKKEFSLSDVVLAFIASDEEYVDERPATTRLGRAVTRRAEIDFSFF